MKTLYKTLTTYQLACGYVQEARVGADKIELYKEHNAYHVRRFADTVCGRKVQEAWLVFDGSIEARKAFRRQVSIAKNINEGALK